MQNYECGMRNAEWPADKLVSRPASISPASKNNGNEQKTCLERGGSFALLTFSIKAAADMSSLRWQCGGLGSMAAADGILFRHFLLKQKK